MSIISDLEQILSARYGKDVRQAIHDSIEEGYNIAVQAQGTAESSQDSAEAYANAALVSEQKAQDYMELAEQYKNEAFAGTPTGYSALVSKVNSIYKETASSFGVVGTVEGLALAHTIYGMSEQDGTPTPSVPVDIDSAVANFYIVGKNLFKRPYGGEIDGVTENNGITYTINSDGSITANGTATATSRYYIAYNNSGATNPKLNPNLYYTLSGAPSGAHWSGSNLTYALYTSGNSYYNTDESSPTFKGDITWGGIAIVVNGGVTLNNVVFKPMLRLSTVSDTNYKQHTSQTVATDLVLRAIEVTSSDDYNLVKDGKYYITDTLDWDEDSGYSITRRIGNIDSYNSESLTTIWMSSKDVYAEGTTPTAGANVTYILTTTTSESVTSANAQALLGLKTYDEATSIDATGDVAPSVTLEYSKDRNTALALIGHNMAHINALKIADLSV